MAETIDQISSRLRIEYPFPQRFSVGGEQRDMTREEYDLWIAEQAAFIRQQQLEAEAEAVRREIRIQIINRLPQAKQNYLLMTTNPNLPTSEQRRIANENTELVYWIAQALIDKGIIVSG